MPVVMTSMSARALVGCLDDQVDLTSPVIGAAVVNARLGGLCIDPHGLSNERLEHLREERSVSGRSNRRRDGHELGTGGDTAEQCPRIHAKQSRGQCGINQVVTALPKAMVRSSTRWQG